MGIEMTLHIFSCVFCFVFASLYSSTTAQDVQVCVSFGGPASTEPFINVNWTFPDNEVNIMFEDRGITNRVYNRTSGINIPLRLNVGQTTVNVTVCRLNNISSCQSVVAATTPVYNFTWTRINNTTLQFTCEVACRTPVITGCIIRLVDNNNENETLSNMSSIVNGTNETFSSHFVIVLVTGVDPTAEYTATATPQTAVVNEVAVSLSGIKYIIPAAVQVSNTAEQTSATLTPSVTTSIMLDTTLADMSTTSSATPTSMPIGSIASTPSNTVTAGAANDDDDDDGYLPVIIAASCACMLLLVVAIILVIIIIRVKRRGTSSNLSSPSASKINNYDDLGDVKYFPMLDSQNNIQKSQSPPDDIQNQESHIKKAPEYELPVFTSVEQNPQVAASYDVLAAEDVKYDNPDGILNPKSQSNDPPVDPLYDPVTLESAPPRDGPKSPVAEYDKLMHSPTPQGTCHIAKTNYRRNPHKTISHFPPSIYDTLSEKNLRDHYEFPDRKDENGMIESHTPLKRVATGNGDEYTVPQTS